MAGRARACRPEFPRGTTYGDFSVESIWPLCVHSSPEMARKLARNVWVRKLPPCGWLAAPGGSHMPIGPRFPIGLSTWHVVFRASYGPPPHIFDTRFARAKPRAMYANRSYIKREKQWVSHLTFIKKYDIIFKKGYVCAGGGSAI